MASVLPALPPPALLPCAAAPRRLARPAPSPALAVLGFALLLVAAGPRAYLLGSGDTWAYLDAARCIARHGLCLPHDHWQRRLPLTLPTGAALRLGGEGFAALVVVPLGYALAALALYTRLVARRFGAVPALLAGLALAATPVVAGHLLELAIDLPEFAFLLAAVTCLDEGWRRSGDKGGSGSGTGWALAGGAMLGVGIVARPTALALLPMLLAGALLLRRPRWAVAIVAGAALPLVAEALGYARATGDPLRPWRLSLAHTAVPSSELMPGVDLRRSPLFNPAFIGGWRHAAGLHLHWSVDGLLNLVANPEVALTLACAALFAVRERHRLHWRDPDGRLLIIGMAGAAFWFAALTYGFAIDPKPRMYLPVVAVAAALFGVLGAAARHRSGLLVGTCLALMLAKGTIAAVDRPELTRAGPVAARWAAGDPRFAVERRTARFLALVPAVAARPVAGTAPADEVLLIDEGDCGAGARKTGLDGWRTIRAAPLPRAEPAAMTAWRGTGLFLQPATVPVLCLLSRSPPPPPGRAASPPR